VRTEHIAIYVDIGAEAPVNIRQEGNSSLAPAIT